MQLTKQQIQHVADLARIKIDENKLDYYAEELSEVLKYVEQLNELDTENVEPKAHAAGTVSIFREDQQRAGGEKTRADIVRGLLERVPFLEKNFAKVKSVFNREQPE